MVTTGRALLLLLLTFTTVACVSQSQPSRGGQPPAPSSTYPPSSTPPAPIIEGAPGGQTTPKPEASVTLALQDESQRAAAAGDLARAIAILERAIRIQPDRAELWIDLARLQLQDGNPAQAEQLARKALLFTGKQYDLEQQAWVVIANARAAQG